MSWDVVIKEGDMWTRGIVGMMVIGVIASMMTMSAVAEQDPQDLRLIKDFKRAVLSKDEERIHATWMKLWNNKDLVAYMKAHDPETFLLYRSHRLVERVDRLRAQYGGAAPRHSYGGGLSVVEKESAPVASIGSGKDPSNRSRIRKNLNSRQPPNNVRVKEAPNQKRLSNQEAVRNAVNNGRRIKTFSNSRIYKRRYRPNRVR